jgi:PRTRC genetic system protein E
MFFERLYEHLQQIKATGANSFAFGASIIDDKLSLTVKTGASNLVAPLVLTGKPEEFETDFFNILSNYKAKEESFQAQKAAAAPKAISKSTKVPKSNSASTTESADGDDGDDENNGTSNDEEQDFWGSSSTPDEKTNHETPQSASAETKLPILPGGL